MEEHENQQTVRTYRCNKCRLQNSESNLTCAHCGWPQLKPYWPISIILFVVGGGISSALLLFAGFILFSNGAIQAPITNSPNESHTTSEEIAPPLAEEVSEESQEESDTDITDEDGSGSLAEETPPQEKSTTNDAVNALLKQGDYYLQIKNYKKAISLYKEVVEKDPKNLRAHWGLNDAYDKVGDYWLSSQEYQKILKLDPKVKQKLDKVLEKASYVGQEEVEHFKHFKQGESYFKSGLYDNAINEFNIFLSKSDTNPLTSYAYTYLAVIYSSRGLDDTALSDLKMAIKIDPRNPGAHTLLGSYYADFGQYSKAIEELNKGLNIEPKMADAHVILSEVYCKVGNYDLAFQEANLARKYGMEPRDSNVCK